jgi:hypothetical protein
MRGLGVGRYLVADLPEAQQRYWEIAGVSE